ncbi:MAG: MotA/TolQ/ExbB proton channel family protein [Phycisphaerales bacterium]|nr:MotA/TolQ/ExbB proton channel family protein [Phycisphaerales bacterium]MCB9841166.1 MotA/TolQ/ExbB proton channel family protein [Phycisphaeraceae bacterium]
MDKASLIGCIIGLICFGFVAFEASHGQFEMFFSLEGVFTVIGGSISVVFMSMPMEKLLRVPGYLKSFLFHKAKSPAEMVELFSRLSEKARRDGILALESDIQSLDDKFLAAGLKAAVDGVDPGAVEANLRMEILAMQDRHKAGKKFFDLIKLYGPGWGLVGTLIGQIGMFGQLGGSIEAMGHMLALAVVATLYGTVAANAIAGPIGDKLAIRSGEEILRREMMIQGILSIQAGDNPRVTTDRLLAFIPSAVRAKLQAAA